MSLSLRWPESVYLSTSWRTASSLYHHFCSPNPSKHRVRGLPWTGFPRGTVWTPYVRPCSGREEWGCWSVFPGVVFLKEWGSSPPPLLLNLLSCPHLISPSWSLGPIKGWGWGLGWRAQHCGPDLIVLGLGSCLPYSCGLLLSLNPHPMPSCRINAKPNPFCYPSVG